MGKSKLNETYIYLKSALKCDSFDVTIVIKIPFFRVSVTIELDCSLLQFVTMKCLINWFWFGSFIDKYTFPSDF